MTSTPGTSSDHTHELHERDRGFTLVEIVIAIVLVGILSAVAVVGIGSLTSKGSEAACSASLDAAKAGSVVYLASNAAYPTTLLQMTSSSPPALTLPSGVTPNPAGTTATGSGWTLTMTPGSGGGAPQFSCTASGGAAATGTSAVGTTACPGPYAEWVGEYYATVTLPPATPTPTPTLCRNDAAIGFASTSAAPAPGIPADNFSVRWTRTVTFTAATYNFTLGSDDGSRLYIDGVLVINHWGDHSYSTQSASRALTAGEHTVVVEFYERGGSQQATLAWT
jgi:prepilin-type N-terminal cleavage/methylation domain-containing protein